MYLGKILSSNNKDVDVSSTTIPPPLTVAWLFLIIHFTTSVLAPLKYIPPPVPVAPKTSLSEIYLKSNNIRGKYILPNTNTNKNIYLF